MILRPKAHSMRAVETLWTLLGQKDPASPTNTWGSVKGGQCQGKVTWLEMLWLSHTKVTVSESFCLFKVFMYVHPWMFSRCMKIWKTATIHCGSLIFSYPTTDFIAKPACFAAPYTWKNREAMPCLLWKPRGVPPGHHGPRRRRLQVRDLKDEIYYSWWCTWQLNEIEWGLSNRFVDLNIESNKVWGMWKPKIYRFNQCQHPKHLVKMVLSPRS